MFYYQVHAAVKPTLGVFAGNLGHRRFRGELDSLCKNRASRAELGVAGILRRAMAEVDPEILEARFKKTEDAAGEEREKMAKSGLD